MSFQIEGYRYTILLCRFIQRQIFLLFMYVCMCVCVCVHIIHTPITYVSFELSTFIRFCLCLLWSVECERVVFVIDNLSVDDDVVFVHIRFSRPARISLIRFGPFNNSCTYILSRSIQMCSLSPFFLLFFDAMNSCTYTHTHTRTHMAKWTDIGNPQCVNRGLR